MGEQEAQPCRGCPALEIHRRDQNDGSGPWHIDIMPAGSLDKLSDRTSQVTIIFAEADAARGCTSCKRQFEEILDIPDIWWAPWCRRSNGYYGCEDNVDDNGALINYASWLRFVTKRTILDPPAGMKEYYWQKCNVFTHWTRQTKQTVIVVFDARLLEKDKLLSSLKKPLDASLLADPYWAHVQILEDVVRLHDLAVWSVRDVVRRLEKNREDPAAPSPDYARLHDLARHAIHVSETADLAVKVIHDIIFEHERFLRGYPSTDASSTAARNRISMRMAFWRQALQSLAHRASANKERLLNEIQLCFHTVAQYDSSISVEIGRATQYDSFAMKTIAFLTMSFLPATFVSALFSMSFFRTDGDGQWSVSDDFWIYWVVAAPITVVSLLLWYYWPRFFPPDVIGRVQPRPRGERLSRRDVIETARDLTGSLIKNEGHEHHLAAV